MNKMYNMITLCFVLVILENSLCLAQQFKTPEERREYEQKYDKLNIINKAEMRSDTSKDFNTIPSDYPEVKDFDVSKSLTTIDFAIVQGLDPFYLVRHPKGNGIYGGWGDVTRGPDGCFYFSIGNHRSYGGATAYIIRYDPSTKTQKIVLDSQKLIGWTDDEFGEGKFHGDPDIDPGGDMWLLTFFGPYPTQEELDKGIYRGGYLVYYNIFTGKSENLGIPLEGESWPYHCYDWERGVVFGVGELKGMVIAYDTRARKMIYGGCPPPDIHWPSRNNLLDRETGKIYATNSKSRDQESYHFVSWERQNNKFTIMKCETPKNPITGKSGSLRAYTKKKDDDGAFWCFDRNGTLFKFYPEEDRTELVGVNWGKSGKYMANMRFSPGKRYIYYVMDAATDASEYGTPVVQYDTKTNRKKVIAFLNDFCLGKYGYSPGGTYGFELDEKGESIFFYTNGRFTTKEKGSGYGRPAIFHVHIPESERIE
ncbi:hypothetical protein ACFL1R_07530 [Candidatus Latescibacterota bacterium]